MSSDAIVIQAMIVEVTLTNDDEFGIELGFQGTGPLRPQHLVAAGDFADDDHPKHEHDRCQQRRFEHDGRPRVPVYGSQPGHRRIGHELNREREQVGTQELTNFGVVVPAA